MIRSCDVVLAWAEPSAKIYELRGIAKNAIEDFSGAIGDFTQAMALSVEADRPRLLRYRGWSNLANEAFRAAVQDFDEAIRLAPTNADAYVGRGTARGASGYTATPRSMPRTPSSTATQARDSPSAVARIYSQAALAVSIEARTKRVNADRALLRYQDLALRYVRLARAHRPSSNGRLSSRDDSNRSRHEAIARRVKSLERLRIDEP